MRSSRVLDSEEDSNIVMEFTPGKFPLEITQVVSNFRDQQEKEKSDFRMDDVIKQTTGVSELEKQELERKIDERALEKLKDIQEGAYKEGYDLGCDEGRKHAFDKYEAQIVDNLARWDQLMKSVETLKEDLVSFNEAHIVKTLTLMASRLAMREFEINPDAILPVIRRSLELSQAEENVRVRVSQEDLEFIEKMRAENLKESDPLKRVHIEADPEVGKGGCVIETNYGVVDASIDERLNKLWQTMEESMPVVHDVIAAEAKVDTPSEGDGSESED